MAGVGGRHAIELAQRLQLDGDAGGAGGVDHGHQRILAPRLGALARGVQHGDVARSRGHQLAHRTDAEHQALGHDATPASSAAMARAAAAGSAASRIGRPTTIRSAPSRRAAAGVAMRC